MKQKLTDKLIRNISGKDKRQYIGDTEIRGLTLVISKQSSKVFKQSKDNLTKSFYMNYRSVSHGPTKEFIGHYGAVTLHEARRKAKKIAAAVVEKTDRYTLKKTIGQGHTLRTLLDLFYEKRLKTPKYAPKSISAYKNTFETWVLKKSNNPAVRKFYDFQDYADMQIHLISKALLTDIHVAVSAKAPTVANRLIAYLKVIFNFAIDRSFIKSNPCIGIKFNKENETMKILTSDQIEAVVDACFVKDDATGKLNLNYYFKKGYGAVACMGIVWALRTGRRSDSEGLSIRWDMINWKTKRIYLENTKVGPMNYRLDDNALDILETIKNSNYIDLKMANCKGKLFKTNEFNGPFCYNDLRKEYVFPSYRFGKKTSDGKVGRKPHISNVDATWKKVLKDLNIPYLPFKQCRHSFATDFYKKTKNLKALQRQLGHSKLMTTSKYLKYVELDYEESLDQYSKKTKQPKNLNNIQYLETKKK